MTTIDLLNTLWAWGLTQSWGDWLTLAASIFAAIAVIVPLLPVKLTSKIPNWVMKLINFIAAKSKLQKLAAKASQTDHHGNPKQ